MKRKIASYLSIFTIVFYMLSFYPVKAAEETKAAVKAYIRVEGIKGTIAEGLSEGETVMELLENLLKSKNIGYEIKQQEYGKELISVDGITKKTFGRTDGWMYYYKSGTTIDLLPELFSEYKTKAEESYIFFYGEWDKTSFVNSITFNPEIVKAGSSFTMKFGWKYLDWASNKTMEKPIKNVIVNIDGLNYITDDKGEITVQPLELGEHTYNISGYEIGDVPRVVMDKGIFAIDNVKSPSVSFDPQKIGQSDNSNINKNIDEEIKALTSYLSANNDSPWTGVTLSKFGIKGGEGYIKEMVDFIKEYGVENMSNTDLEKVILNLTALGYTPYNFNGKDLVKELFNRDLNSFLLNDTIFALIAHHNLNVKTQYSITEDKLITKILESTLTYSKDGKELTGWTLSGDTLNPDITGSVLSALAPYNDIKHPEVMKAVKGAVNSLSAVQNESGYTADNFGLFSETLSFVITGLTAVGENSEGTKFTKLKGDLVSALLSFKGTQGQFKHSLQSGNDYVATEQALRALYSLSEFKNKGKFNFYSSEIDAASLKVYKAESTNNSVGDKELPKTGSSIDYDVLMAAALLFFIAGVFLMLKSKNNHSNN